MNKILFCVVSIILCSHQALNAQVLDAIRGHVQDLKSRLSANQKIEGQILKLGTIDTKAKGQDLVHNSSGTWTLVKLGQQLPHDFSLAFATIQEIANKGEG